MIHPTAIVDKNAQIAGDVEIGPYCIIEGGAQIGAGSRLESHVVVQGNTVLGTGCTVSPFASLGGPPQDIGYKYEPTGSSWATTTPSRNM